MRSVDQLTALRKVHGVIGDLSNPHTLRGMLLDMLEENKRLHAEIEQWRTLATCMRKTLDERK